ncbi:MAG: hypothetical protein AAFO69_01240 [Bacteroidota bacterium]
MSIQLHAEKRQKYVALKKLLNQQDEPEVLKRSASSNHWYYFRRSHPVKIEVYVEEDFAHQPKSQAEAWLVNKADLFSVSISSHENDLLCLMLEDQWHEFIRYENQWITKPENEYITWRHYLFAEGKIVLR